MNEVAPRPPLPLLAGEVAGGSATAGEGSSARTDTATNPLEPPASIPCATPNLQPAEVWQAVLDAASERASVHTMVSALSLVSLNPDRAVIGHAQRDRLTAEMALGHLVVLFERTLGKRIAVSLLQLKDAPRTPQHTTAESPTSAPTARPAAPPRQPQAPVPASSPTPAPPPPPRPAAPVDVEAARANPLVQRAAELLNAKVVRITARSDTSSTPPAP